MLSKGEAFYQGLPWVQPQTMPESQKKGNMNLEEAMLKTGHVKSIEPSKWKSIETTPV